MRRHTIPRILLTILGIAMIALGAGRLALGVVGEQGTAVITSIRRQGGELATAGKPGRYFYHIGYSFSLPDGRIVDGWTARVGDSTYVKADGKSTMPVRYLKVFPEINTPESSTRLSVGQPVLIALGIFLIVVMNRDMNRKKIKKRRRE